MHLPINNPGPIIRPAFGHILILAIATLCLPGHPADAKSYFEKSLKLYASGEETEARRALRHELLLHPDNLEARYNLAVMLEHIQHEKGARATYLENMRRKPHLPTIINLSAIYVRQGRRDLAKVLLQQATGAFRDEAAPWYLLARMSEADGNNGLARRQYRQAIKADPLNGFAHIRFARFLSSHGSGNRALEHAKRATELIPDCAPCWKIMGDVLWKNGQLKQSYAAYQKSVAIAPNPLVRKQMVQLLYGMGENRRAKTMERILGKKP